MTSVLMAPVAGGGAPAIARRWSWRAFGCCFGLAFVAMAIWSWSMPLLTGPDEATHVVKAAGVIRGQFVGDCRDHGNPVCPSSSSTAAGAETEVHVPAFYSLLRNGGNLPGTSLIDLSCAAHRPAVPASCMVFPKPAQYVGFVRDAWVYDGRYPPLYYAIVGVPSLFGEGLWAVYLMRLAGAAACALLVAAGATSVLCWSRRRALLVGLLVALTPMVLYLGGVVNPSGLEIAAAICLWSAGTVLVLERAEDPPPALVRVVVASAVVLVFIRSLSPLWLALCLVALALLAGAAKLRALLSRRGVRLGAVLVAASTAAALAWIVYEHATNIFQPRVKPLPSSTPLSTIFETALRLNHAWLPTLVGVFGSYDTHLPSSSYVIWYAAAAVLFVAALVLGSDRERLVLVALALAIVFVPTLVVTSHARVDNYVWNGRDTLPLAVGLPIVCGGVLDLRADLRLSGRRRFGLAVALALIGVAQFGALYEALRRYSVGASGGIVGFLASSSWAPPGGELLPLLVELILLVTALVLVFRVIAAEARAPSMDVDRPLEATV